MVFLSIGTSKTRYISLYLTSASTTLLRHSRELVGFETIMMRFESHEPYGFLDFKTDFISLEMLRLNLITASGISIILEEIQNTWSWLRFMPAC